MQPKPETLVLASRSEARLAEIAVAINEDGGDAIHVVADVGRCGKIAARRAGRQQYDQPPSRDPEGALWHASSGGDIYGRRPSP